MKEKISWFKFFISRGFFKNLLICIALLISLIFLVLMLLKSYTNQNNLIELPDYKSYSVEKMDSIMTDMSLRYVIIDSVYNDNFTSNTIIDQDPKPGTLVKPNRRIYFTIVSKNKKLVTTPNLIDLTVRRATAKLNSIGLVVGKLNYVPDMAKNAVLKQMFEGKEILPGEVLPVGSVIDLEIGDGLSEIMVELPLLEGLNLEDAQIVLQMRSLKLGLIVFDKSVVDSSNAVIYNQIPNPNNSSMINLGRNIDVYLKSYNSNE
jgi:beta-lactam-binding protein with PASTA domain